MAKVTSVFLIFLLLKLSSQEDTALEDRWQVLPNRWNEWIFSAYAEAVHTTAALNAGQVYGRSDVKIDIPIFVMNIFHRPDRRESASKHLANLGFTNVSFPPTISWRDLRVDDLVADKMVDWNAFKRSHPHQNDTQLLQWISNAYCQLLAIEQAVLADLPLFGIFEDDLVPARRSASDVTAAILRAVEQLPPTADMLYLEACHESCGMLAYSPARPALARARHPSCAAAVLFTRRGARRALGGALPVWDVIDVMYPSLIERGALEARRGGVEG
jgi:hypothetical protein